MGAVSATTSLRNPSERRTRCASENEGRSTMLRLVRSNSPLDDYGLRRARARESASTWRTTRFRRRAGQKRRGPSSRGCPSRSRRTTWLPNPVLISVNCCAPKTGVGTVAHGRFWPPQRSTSADGETPSWPKVSSPQQ